MHVDLIRVEDSALVTRGVVLVDGAIHCMSLELPDRSNQVNVSCIPPGTYNCVRAKSRAKGECVRVLDVPGRTGILIHKGNTTKDTEGCVLLGTTFGALWGKRAVLDSRAAMEKFLGIVPDTFTLEIRYA